MKHLEKAMECYGYSRLYHRDWLESIFKSGGHNFPISSNWCSIFIDFIAKESGLQRPEKAAAARNWLKVGLAVQKPKIGDVVVFWRESPDSWKGHVGIFISRDSDNKMYLLGGNQGPNRSVVAQKYPFDRVLGYRRLIADERWNNG